MASTATKSGPYPDRDLFREARKGARAKYASDSEEEDDTESWKAKPYDPWYAASKNPLSSSPLPGEEGYQENTSGTGQGESVPIDSHETSADAPKDAPKYVAYNPALHAGKAPTSSTGPQSGEDATSQSDAKSTDTLAHVLATAPVDEDNGKGSESSDPGQPSSIPSAHGINLSTSAASPHTGEDAISQPGADSTEVPARVLAKTPVDGDNEKESKSSDPGQPSNTASAHDINEPRGQPSNMTSAHDIKKPRGQVKWSKRLVNGLIYLSLTLVLILLTFALRTIEVYDPTTCSVIDKDPIDQGIVPYLEQERFGKSAWAAAQRWNMTLDPKLSSGVGSLLESSLPRDTTLLLHTGLAQLNRKLLRSLAPDSMSTVLHRVEQHILDNNKLMIDCVGPELVEGFTGTEQAIHNPKMSPLCIMRLHLQWDPLQTMFKLLVDTSAPQRSSSYRHALVKDTYQSANALQLLVQQAQQELSSQLHDLVDDAVEYSLSGRCCWQVPTLSEGLPSLQQSTVRAYIALLHLSLSLTALQSNLLEREKQLDAVISSIDRFQERELVAFVKHGSSTRVRLDILLGRVNVFPLRAAAFLQDLRATTDEAAEKARWVGACLWLRQHMPDAVSRERAVGCRTKKVAAWKVWIMEEAEVRQTLRQAAWEELWKGMGEGKGRVVEFLAPESWMEDLREAGVC